MVWRAAFFASLLLLAPGVLLANPASAPGSARGADESAATTGQDEEQPAAFDIDDLKRRLAEKGASLGTPVLIRIFKQEAELELWLLEGDRFELFAVHSICKWSGTLGPKLAEGDKQSPEGFYSVGPRQVRRSGRWRRSLDIGFPNTYDKTHGRTGSYILVHGGCTSTGCFAMTDPVMEEIFTLSEAALAQHQERIQVHIFPFRMTEQNMSEHAQSPWSGFWLSLKAGYDQFEMTRVPPQVRVCDDHYAIGLPVAENAGGCIANVSQASDASARLRAVRKIVRARRTRRSRVARRTTQSRQASRRPARNTRQAHTPARAQRMAARAGVSYLGGPKRHRR